jgi:protein disulfide-isomerase
MKNILFSAFVLLTFISFSQKEELTWHSDLQKAISLSQKEKKPMMLFFTGSDWCGWCHRLQREVFNTPAFTTWASSDVILVELDFPRNKVLPQNIMEQNQMLQQQFGVQGYPTVWFVNVTKEADKLNLAPLSSSGYLQGGPEVWITNAKAIINGGK